MGRIGVWATAAVAGVLAGCVVIIDEEADVVELDSGRVCADASVLECQVEEAEASFAATLAALAGENRVLASVGDGPASDQACAALAEAMAVTDGHARDFIADVEVMGAMVRIEGAASEADFRSRLNGVFARYTDLPPESPHAAAATTVKDWDGVATTLQANAVASNTHCGL